MNMELGNMAFGHSRGQYPIDDRYGYLEAFEPLLEATGDGTCYASHADNEIFEMHPYCWCDDENCSQCGTGEQFNFLHKPSGFGIRWYKYAFRDAYMNQDVSKQRFAEIVAECVDSIGGKDKVTP